MTQCSWKLGGEAREYLQKFYEILDAMTDSMTEAPLTDSISHNLIVQLTPLGEALIQMCENARRFDSAMAVHKAASRISQSQRDNICALRSALEGCGRLKNTCDDLCAYKRGFHLAVRAMLAEVCAAEATDDICADFVNEMTLLLTGAAGLIENALRFTLCPELVVLANGLILSQRRTLCELAFASNA